MLDWLFETFCELEEVVVGLELVDDLFAEVDEVADDLEPLELVESTERDGIFEEDVEVMYEEEALIGIAVLELVGEEAEL